METRANSASGLLSPAPRLLSPASRFPSIDVLRGAVMVLMTVDHVRDFFDRSAMAFSPTDLEKTTPILFLTRWITHYCLPTFMFCAGMGAFLWFERSRRTRGELSRFLLTRGVWFLALELTGMQLAYDFNVSSQNLVLLLILFIFGECMLVLAALIWLPARWLAALSLAVILLHNLLDGVKPEQFHGAAWVWKLLHQPGVFECGGRLVLVTYTLLPWIGVMGAGFCFARLFALEQAVRQRWMMRIGLAATAGFFLLRGINLYGDPAPWSQQRSLVFTAMSFLNTTKYPASLDFLLMTLGPAILALAWLDRKLDAKPDGRLARQPLNAAHPLVVLGRVPMFYFVLHFYLIHTLAVVFAYVRYGRAALGFMFQPLPSIGGSREAYPADFGYPLWVTYAVWALVVLLLYPLCKWFAGVKARRRDWWLSYL
jgi:uncharacterized membrane protein